MKRKGLSLLLCTAMAASAVMGGSCLASAEESKEIVYWSEWESTEPQAIAIQALADEYEEETGIHVNIEWKGRSGITDGIVAALDSGVTVDMFDQGLWRMASVFGEYLMDLEDLVEETGYAETANEYVLQYSRNTSGGTLKAIPYQLTTYCFWYNADIFEKAGVTETPKTWEEFKEVCQKIKDAGYTPITTDDAYATNMWNWHLGRYVGETAETAISDNNLWDDPAVLQSANDIAELASLGYFSETVGSNVWPTGQNVEFGGGQVAMYFGGSFIPNEVSAVAGDDFNWGAFAYPATGETESNVEGAFANDTTYGTLSGQAFGISKDSKMASEAFGFIQKLTKGAGDAKLSVESNSMPADMTTEEWPEILSGAKEVLNDITTMVNYSAAGDADMAPVIKENLLKLYAGTITGEEFVETLVSAAG